MQNKETKSEVEPYLQNHMLQLSKVTADTVEDGKKEIYVAIVECRTVALWAIQLHYLLHLL